MEAKPNTRLVGAGVVLFVSSSAGASLLTSPSTLNRRKSTIRGEKGVEVTVRVRARACTTMQVSSSHYHTVLERRCKRKRKVQGGSMESRQLYTEPNPEPSPIMKQAG